MEYNQYHFSATDHGYWPATPTVGTTVPSSWPLDGLTEVRMSSWPPVCGYRCTCARCSSTNKTSSNTCWATRPDLAAGAGGQQVTTTQSVTARYCWCADAEACQAGHFVRSFIPGSGRRCMPREHATFGPTPCCPWWSWPTPPLASPTPTRRTGAITAPSYSARTHEPR